MDALPLPREADLNSTPFTTPDPLTFESKNILHVHLEKRYSTISIPSTYGHLNTSPPPGTVAGIVLGSVGGVVLILYLTFLALNPGGLARGSPSVIDEEVVVRSRRSPSRRSEVIEVVEERDRDHDRRRDSYRRPGSRRNHIVVEESMTGTSVTDDPDMVEVIEEESSALSTISPEPRRGGRYRTVDPLEYGGGSSYDGDSHYRG
ncbi:uncharacterized protein N7473_010072 [Penicillium subrubescens]|uniref:Uncharacterized protein n=1 Tax=Penicillium subrubescens TaxID=1316194 RepID=A0A1Q5U1J6_9EURO|nr:uncharacterized protein N7473_010072 [Penicillium subrubescens]KAJ5883186.1 hypothetical protein N7473_010072 [Penicillium subrubescens]OKP06358.1 hypothetical protein PENSUB_6348 [Penicillium subrubescens]